MSPLKDRIAPPADRGTNVLLLTPSLDEADQHACTDLLTLTEPAETDVLHVTLTQSADQRLDQWRSEVGEEPARVGVIDIDMASRSAGGGGASPAAGYEGVYVDSIQDPGDLTQLGVAISGCLTDWSDEDHRTAVCFHGVTPLLQYSSTQQVYRFLHALTRQLRSTGAVAHFHLSPDAHETRTVRTLSDLFDHVVRFDDGEFSVESRG